jgi:hypothetical protein
MQIDMRHGIDGMRWFCMDKYGQVLFHLISKTGVGIVAS